MNVQLDRHCLLRYESLQDEGFLAELREFIEECYYTLKSPVEEYPIIERIIFEALALQSHIEDLDDIIKEEFYCCNDELEYEKKEIQKKLDEADDDTFWLDLREEDHYSNVLYTQKYSDYYEVILDEKDA